MHQGLIFANSADFYYLSRLCLVKDEAYFDKFDRAFQHFMTGLDTLAPVFTYETGKTMLEFLRKQFLAELSESEKAALEGLLQDYHESNARVQARLAAANQELIDGKTLRQQLGPLEKASAVNNQGVNQVAPWPAELSALSEVSDPKDADDATTVYEGLGEGDPGSVRSAQDSSGSDGSGEDENGSDDAGHGENGFEGRGAGFAGESGEKVIVTDEAGRSSAEKIWVLRRFRDYDSDVELGTRNLKLALRRLRKFARTSTELEFDLGTTINNTARNAGLLDIVMMPERRNSVKVLLLLDTGGSMDEYVQLCEQLFSASSTEFRHLHIFYFHNFVYEGIWQDNDRRLDEKIRITELIGRFGADYKLILVGDAQVGLPEIQEPGGSLEHFNQLPGSAWLTRLKEHYRKLVWLNPVHEKFWLDSPSIQLTRKLVADEMYHLSPKGIEAAMRVLAR
jgi:uncharacterized protein with von Willebrand factor type A (vWA) domain